MNNVSASRSTMRNIRADIHVKLGGASAGRSGLKRRVEWAFDDEPKASETLVALEKLTVCGYDDEDTVCFLPIASRAICVDMHIILAATLVPVHHVLTITNHRSIFHATLDSTRFPYLLSNASNEMTKRRASLSWLRDRMRCRESAFRQSSECPAQRQSRSQTACAMSRPGIYLY